MTQAAACKMLATSTHYNCKLSVSNTQKPAFFNVVNSTKPDIAIITESWFNSEIRDAEYFNTEHCP